MKWEEEPDYTLDVKNCIFNPQEFGGNVISAPQIITSNQPPPRVAPNPPTFISPIELRNRSIVHRREERIVIEQGMAEMTLGWCEFIDREAKSIYFTELLRRKAMEARNDSE